MLTWFTAAEEELREEEAVMVAAAVREEEAVMAEAAREEEAVMAEVTTVNNRKIRGVIRAAASLGGLISNLGGRLLRLLLSRKISSLGGLRLLLSRRISRLGGLLVNRRS